MPRIKDSTLESVIYLYPTVQHASEGVAIGGTGFLVGVPSSAAPGRSYVYAVTNSHVIREGNSPVVRLNTSDGKTEVVPYKDSNWFHHPDGDDLAVTIVLGLRADRFAFKCADVSMLVTKERLKELNVGPGDDVFMVGRFISHEGRQRNLPAVRFGNISMMPWEPIRNEFRGINQESFLVEMRSLSGYSGSPVFLRSQGKIHVLGVDWGHLPIFEHVLEKDKETRVSDGWVVKGNSGQAAVVPAWRLIDLLNSEEIVKAREELEERLRKQRPQGVVLDVAQEERPSGPQAEHLKIEGNWEDALKEALRQGKPPKDVR
jgi:hypothetical protein